MSVEIKCPIDDGTIFRVVNQSGSFFVKANGEWAPPIALPLNKLAQAMAVGGNFAVKVKVKDVAPVFGNGTAADDHPPGDATEVTLEGQKWCHDLLKAHGFVDTGNPVDLWIIGWLVNVNTPTVGIEKDSEKFKASTSATDECLGCVGSGSGGIGSIGIVSGSAAKGQVALSMAPLMWGLLVSGFEAAKGVLNGPFALDLKHVVGGYCVWDNGGDGAATPRVELRCESPLVTTWRLTLTHGATVETYTRPAAEWNPLTPNAVVRAGRTGTGVPDQLILTPS